MAYRATYISHDPLRYFLQHDDEGSHLRVSDIVLRENQNPKEVFSQLIRTATGSCWSHSALLYLINDPTQGYDNTFLVEATTSGIRMVNWRNEVIPYEEFTVGIKRPRLDWYAETPHEAAQHDKDDPEDVHGIAYLRHVRGIALDQINGLYDHKVVYELAALYTERVAKRHLGNVPVVAGAAAGVATLFKKWDESGSTARSVTRFVCSGLVQYSFFEALRRRIINAMSVPAYREAAMSNLHNMQRVIFREDDEGVIPRYIQQVESGALNLAGPVPGEVLDLLKTATPADFNNNANLDWRYIIRKGVVWRIDEAPTSYQPQDEDETNVLALLKPEHRS